MAKARDIDLVVVGGGPAGLAAAEVASAAGARVLVAEAKPSLGRKFLMAGKSGLNLTMDAPLETFTKPFDCPELAPMLNAFGPRDVQNWAQGLGQEVFTGSSGRVFPKAMKASPLLRAWLGRLADQGVQVALRWRWRGWEQGDLVFDTPQGRQSLSPRATVLALGGASWSRLGSDGAWVAYFPGQTSPFAPANMGLHLAWSAPLKALAGTPLKSVKLRILDRSVIGECVISETGLEGSAVYALSKQAREALAGGAARLVVDLAPNRTQERLVEALSRPRGKQSWGSFLRKFARLDAPKRALLYEAGSLPSEPQALAHRIKALPLEITGTAPLEEAISVSGGLRWDQVSETLALRDRPEVFVAGEMLDWEVPTGGYLITGCLATGRWAGRSAAEALGLLPK